MKNTSASARTPRAVGAHGPPSRQGQQVARQGTSGRPPGGRGAERMDGPGRWQGRAGLYHDKGSPGGGGGACDGASEPPVEERAGGLVARRQGRVWDGSASVPTWTSGGGQGVTGRTTRDRARAVDAASATTSQTTQARCHTGTLFIHCRLETYNLIYS